MKENVEMKINISLQNPISQTLKIEYVNESDRRVKVEKLNPHTNIKIYNSEKQLLPQIYGSFAQGIPSYFELNSNSKMQHEISLRKNYDLSAHGSYDLIYKIYCECLEGGGSDAPDPFYIEGTTKIRFDEGVGSWNRSTRYANQQAVNGDPVEHLLGAPLPSEKPNRRRCSDDTR